MTRKGKRVLALMSREMYLELFGLTPEEVFTPEELSRIEKCVRESADEPDEPDKVGEHARELRRQKHSREKQRRKGKK